MTYSLLSSFKRFKEINPEIIGKDPKRARTLCSDIIEHFPELSANPFADRFCSIFATGRLYKQDEEGVSEEAMTFIDFIDMVSCLSKNSPKTFKADWAFKAFGRD